MKDIQLDSNYAAGLTSESPDLSLITLQTAVICTITVYKFPKLSRDEVEAMLGLRLEETRVYQEARSEGEERGIVKGRTEGEHQGEARLVLRLLTRRIGELNPEVQAQVQSLSLAQIESLGEALLDFSEPRELVNWLRSNA